MVEKPVLHSVVLANYNGGVYLKEAIDSVLAQEGVSFELILVDDGSTDGSLALMRDFETRHPGRVLLIDHGRNRGQGAGFNTGVAAAKGDLISFIDSDDVWHADKLRQVQEAFAAMPLAVLHHHNMAVIRDGVTTTELVVDMMALGDIAHRWRRTKCHPDDLPRFAPTSGVSLPRAVLEKIMPCPEVRVCADMWLTFAPLGLGPVSASMTPKADYRIHDGNNYMNAKLKIWRILIEELGPPMTALHERLGVAPYMPSADILPPKPGSITLVDRILDGTPRKALAKFSRLFSASAPKE